MRAPDGGLTGAPFGIAERAAAGVAEAPRPDASRFGVSTQFALAN
ncbi:hypothetical protein N8I71_16360 [Roseibacterium sp. SDUM158016]|nr:hypothetical protein [Roseibacterium sp. SDUM158016]MCU4654414.1 hypothetical protein [Roseibacterium sp. SDUM158016]